MINRWEIETLLRDEAHLVDGDGGDLGPVARVFLDDYTGWPSFCTIEAPAGSHQAYVALHEATATDGAISVPYARRVIVNAPRAAYDVSLSRAEEDTLFDYYGVPIDGVVPVVAHLGHVLETDGDDQVATQELVEESDPERPRRY